MSYQLNCPRCGSGNTAQVGDCPAGNWWTTCAQCGLAVSEWGDYAEAKAGVQVPLSKWDFRFLHLAKFISTWSRDPSTKVGAVITAGKQIISCGYNGFAQGMPDDPELYLNREEKLSRTIHAEVNALLFARTNVHGFSLFTWPFAPCDRCAVQMLQAGITRFVFPSPTPETLQRWGEAFARTKKYFENHPNVTYEEVPLHQIQVMGGGESNA